MKIIFLTLLALLVSSTVAAQPDDPFIGSFTNTQYNIGLRIVKLRGGYGGEFTYQGERYPLTGFGVGGQLSGEYSFQGRKVAFSIMRRGESYTLSSEGIELPIIRGASADPVSPGVSPSPSVSATLLRDPQGSYTCESPPGWTSTAENGGFILRNSGTPVTIVLSSHQENSIDRAISEAADIRNPAENTDIRVRARKLDARTAYALFEGTARNQPVNLELVTVFAPDGGGLVVTINYGRFSPNPEFLPIARSIAASARFTRTDTSTIARQWSERIRGKKLLFLQTDSYGSQRVDINLFANGSYDYQSNTGMMSQGGVGTGTYGGLNRDSGSWKVVEQGGTPTLVLSGSGGTSGYRLAPGATAQQLLLNNRRYFIQPLE